MTKRRLRWIWVSVFVVSMVVGAVVMRWPSFEVRAWTPPVMPPATGVRAINKKLVQVDLLGNDTMVEPEDTTVDAKGSVYGGCVDGRIWRVDRAGKAQVFADTKGRPLGLAFGTGGLLYVADAMKGLLSVSPQGQIQTLATHYKGKSFGLIDDLDVDKNGNIYFSDASLLVRGGRSLDVRADLLSHVPTGRLFRYNAKTKKLSLLLDKLFFANGVAVSRDQTYVLVTETATYKIRRYWIKGPKKGTSEIFARNLRGFPDNINRSSDGGFWVGLTSSRLGHVDKWIHPRVWMKKLLLTLPKGLLPKPKKISLVIKLDAHGKVVQSLYDPTGKTIANVSSAYEANGYLYLGHIYNHSTRIGRYKL